MLSCWTFYRKQWVVWTSTPVWQRKLSDGFCFFSVATSSKRQTGYEDVIPGRTSWRLIPLGDRTETAQLRLLVIMSTHELQNEASVVEGVCSVRLILKEFISEFVCGFVIVFEKRWRALLQRDIRGVQLLKGSRLNWCMITDEQPIKMMFWLF